MRFRHALALVALAGIPAVLTAQATEKIDYAALSRIRAEGLQRSKVIESMIWLADIYGPRLTGSPAIRQAGEWAKKTLTAWGLANVHEESWDFGRGWSLERYYAAMLEPQYAPLIGYPKAWTPGTNGPVTAEVVLAPVATPADMEAWKGRLRGKIVLSQPAREVRMLTGDIVLKMGEREVREAESMPIPNPNPPHFTPPAMSAAQVMTFYMDEGVVAVIDRGSDSDMSAGGSDMSWMTQRTDGGTIFVGSGGGHDANGAATLPQVTLAVEHYNRIVRALARAVPVKMELDIRVKFHDAEPSKGFNIVAEIPGSDPLLKDEVVIVGAHFDSWHAGTGATDNAAGSAAMMEAARIIQASGLKPRRTIRVALWGGEEEGLLGSHEYVTRHYGDATTTKPEYAKLAAYFNIDNGTGRIRGIWMQENFAVDPIFRQWIAPLKDLGVTTLGPRSVSSTDHASFDAVGLPGFQFIQERLEYNSRTHHSNMDTMDHVQREDMTQMATVVAWFAYNAAMRDEKLPRKPLPAPRAVQ